MKTRRTTTRSSGEGSIPARVERLETEVRKLLRKRSVRREEHDDVLRALTELEQHTHELEVQFKRIAQIQADLDEISRAWKKLKGQTEQ